VDRTTARCFPISFSRPIAVLGRLTGTGPGEAFVAVRASDVTVRQGWAFRVRIPRSAVAGAHPATGRVPLSRGAHGWGGRWLVNGSGRGLVTIELRTPVRARVMGVPVHLRELTVSVEDPDGLLAALA
jgi:hypothetical protein